MTIRNTILRGKKSKAEDYIYHIMFLKAKKRRLNNIFLEIHTYMVTCFSTEK